MSIYRKFFGHQKEKTKLFSAKQAKQHVEQCLLEKQKRGKLIDDPESFWLKKIEPEIIARAAQGKENFWVKDISEESCKALDKIAHSLNYTTIRDDEGNYWIRWYRW